MVEDMENSVLAWIGNAVAWLFIPLGWGDWKSAVAAITGLVAKENVVGTFGVLFGFAEVNADNGIVATGIFGVGTAAAVALILLFLYLLFRPYKESQTLRVTKQTAFKGIKA